MDQLGADAAELLGEDNCRRMNGTALQVRQLSKKYKIGVRQRSYRTLRDSISGIVSRPFHALRNAGKTQTNDEDRTVWALRDVSFDVQPGEVVGVIGRNGAGKSTLLKILSRITEPSAGTADLYGRLGSLLEVGTGFHGELTGRENVYLNGAILGMKRQDIDRQFDRIVAFAEVEKFIDTPVKHYSTGMYMRLAFSVAAHLEPEILLVDEVLAVGDVAFQRKCLGRIGEVAADGRTVLFVSHNMGAIRSLCSKGLVLDQGRVAYFGQIGQSIETYFRLASTGSSRTTEDGTPLAGFGPVSLVGRTSTIKQGESFEVQTTMRVPLGAVGFTLLCLLEDATQRSIFHLRTDSSDHKFAGPSQCSYEIKLGLPALWLEPGLYSLWFKVLYWGESVQSRVLSDVFHLDVSGTSSGWNAVLSPAPEWSLESVEAERLLVEAD